MSKSIPVTVYEEQAPAGGLYELFGQAMVDLENLSIIPDKPKAELVNIGGTLYFKYLVNTGVSHEF